jgi:hypothetical protein
MRYVKFILSKGDPITLPINIAEMIISGEDQLAMVPDEQGMWSGKTINKAHIVSTDIDFKRMERESEDERMRILKIETPGIPEEQRRENIKSLARMRKQLIQKKVISKNI